MLRFSRVDAGQSEQLSEESEDFESRWLNHADSTWLLRGKLELFCDDI